MTWWCEILWLVTWDRRCNTWAMPQFESDSSTIINDVIIVIICLNFSRMRCCKNEKRWKNDCMGWDPHAWMSCSRLHDVFANVAWLIAWIVAWLTAWYGAWFVCHCHGTYCMMCSRMSRDFPQLVPQLNSESSIIMNALYYLFEFLSNEML